MIPLLRTLLRGTPFYYGAARIYHACRRLIMRAQLLFSNVKYLPPVHPKGNYKSQFGQDYHLEKLGLVGRNGFFVEIGSNHPVDNSNSYYLEEHLGWAGVSIDGVDFSKQFKEFRPNTIFINCLIDTKNGEAEFFEVHSVTGWESQISSLYEKNLDLGKGFTADKKIVRTRRLSDIAEIDRQIDVCLIDVEGHEFSVLESIDWQARAPKVFVIENMGEFYPREQLTTFMRDKGYKFVARIGVTDDIFLSKDFTPTRP